MNSVEALDGVVRLLQQCSNAAMQQCSNAAMQQCSNAAMQQCSNAAMQQCSNAAKSVMKRKSLNTLAGFQQLINNQGPIL